VILILFVKILLYVVVKVGILKKNKKFAANAILDVFLVLMIKTVLDVIQTHFEIQPLFANVLKVILKYLNKKIAINVFINVKPVSI
jgi:hypothetical protein